MDPKEQEFPQESTGGRTNLAPITGILSPRRFHSCDDQSAHPVGENGTEAMMGGSVMGRPTPGPGLLAMHIPASPFRPGLWRAGGWGFGWEGITGHTEEIFL